jgi:type III secretion protein V
LANIEASRSTNPANHWPAAIVAEEHKATLEAMGLTVWDPFGFYILTLAAALRSYAHTLLVPSVVDLMLSGLAKARPVATNAAYDMLPPHSLAPTLRALVRDGVPVRNLNRIVALMLRYHWVAEDRGGLDLVSFVRAGLADSIGFKASHGTNAVVVYLLERDVAEGMGRSTRLDEDLAERLRDALHREMEILPRTAQIPGILTEDRCRAAVRDLLRHEFPQVSVYGYRDLPPGFNIQPVARLSW